MAGITPNEGQDYIAEVLYSQETAVQNLTVGLFVNTAGVLTATSAWADVTQVSGTDYAEINLTAGTWSIASGGVATYGSSISWIAGADDWSAAVYGYYVRTREGTPRLLHFEYSPNGAVTMTNGDIYTVDLGTNTESS
jgi:hypothetical protein